MKKIAVCLLTSLLLVFLSVPLVNAEEEKKNFWVSTQERGGDYSYTDGQGILLKGRQQISQYNLNYQAAPCWVFGLTMQASRTGSLKVDDSSLSNFSVDSNGHKLNLGARIDYKLKKEGPWNNSLILSYNQLPISLYKYYNNGNRDVLDLKHDLLIISLASEYHVNPRLTFIGEVGISPWKSQVDGSLKEVRGSDISFRNFQYKAQTSTWSLKGKYKLDKRLTLTLGYRHLKLQGDKTVDWADSPVTEKVNEWIVGLDFNLE